VVAGSALIWQAVEKLTGEPVSQTTALFVLAIGLGLLLIIGLWTPAAATLVAVVELCKVLWKAGDPLTYILLGTIGAALALLGPGLWSVDARVYGWKRIEPTHPKA
jgi:putative oxidoreductase